MSFKEVYIINTSSFLPNEPVFNEEMEEYLGYINDTPSRSKAIVLRNNGIRQRYYALKKGGIATHTNAQMAALAIRNLFTNNPDAIKEIELLCCGTSSPDQMMPSHGNMVHGWLPETKAIEVVTQSGNCCSSMHAFKYAYLSVKTGSVKQSVAAGSERTSASLVSTNFEDEAQKLKELDEDPYIGFEKEFLRWMLSDGAAAFLISDKKNEKGISLRVEWIEGFSYANELETCMYMGSDKLEDGTLKSYLDFTPQEIMEQSVLSIKQDVKLLSKNIVKYGGYAVKAVLDKQGIKSNEIDHFLPHISSEFFKDKLYRELMANGTGIEYDKWFENLAEVGNVGAASVYMMVDDLLHSGKLKPGDKIFLSVPESARFSYMFSMLTVC